MADNTPAAPTQTKKELRFFRSRIAGLSIVVAPARDGEVAPTTVRFTPIYQEWNGGMERFGYLKTGNKVAIDKCLEDPNVDEIGQDDYEKIMKKADDGKEPNVRRAPL